MGIWGHGGLLGGVGASGDIRGIREPTGGIWGVMGALGAGRECKAEGPPEV